MGTSESKLQEVEVYLADRRVIAGFDEVWLQEVGAASMNRLRHKPRHKFFLWSSGFSQGGGLPPMGPLLPTLRIRNLEFHV
jgi:hypothetical protein